MVQLTDCRAHPATKMAVSSNTSGGGRMPVRSAAAAEK